MDQSTSILFSVLKLFIIPVGGGIPAGVMLAQAKGLAWPITTGLYLISDIALALAFEPILRLISMVVGKIPLLTRFGAAFKAASARSAAHIGGTSAGPLGLVLVSFGVDPMTGGPRRMLPVTDLLPVGPLQLLETCFISPSLRSRHCA